MHKFLTRLAAAMLSLFTAYVLSNPLNAQVTFQWAKMYGELGNKNDQAGGAVTDQSGNVYIAGASAAVNGKLDYVTIKYDASGVQQWVSRYDGFNNNDAAAGLAIDPSGNLYVTGYSEDAGGTRDIVTVKYNNAGIQQWATRFNGPYNGNDHAFAIQVDDGGNVYVAGYAAVNGPSDFVTLKYNSSGVQLWARYYNGSGNNSDVAFAIAVDKLSSDVYVAGETIGATSGGDFTTIKYNSSGTEQWVRNFNGSANTTDNGRLIALDGQGNIYVAGLSRALGNIYECTIIKYNPSGAEQWTTHYAGPSNTIFQPNAFIVDNSGNIFITGFTLSPQFQDQCITCKYNSNGVQQWVKLYASPYGGNNIGASMTRDAQGNVYVAALSPGNGTSTDYLTIKYTSDGIESWTQRYDFAGKYNAPASIAINQNNDVFVTGSVLTYGDIVADYYDILTVKYTQLIPVSVTASPDTTVFYGYGSNCAVLKAVASGGVPPYNYAWTSNGNVQYGQQITVCPAITTVYTVAVTDANGATASEQVIVNVIDLRCGNKDNKVTVCHGGKALCIAAPAVAAHLHHGDILGDCANSRDFRTDADQSGMKQENGIIISQVIPNPASGKSFISYELPFDAQVSIKLFDMAGREMKVVFEGKRKAGYNDVVADIHDLVPGTYLCRIAITSVSVSKIYTLKMVVF